MNPQPLVVLAVLGLGLVYLVATWEALALFVDRRDGLNLLVWLVGLVALASLPGVALGT